MTGDECATGLRNFATLLSKIGNAPQPFLIACGPSKDNAEWTQDFFTGRHGNKRRLPDGYAMHIYSNSKVPATKFSVDEMRAQFATFPQLESQCALASQPCLNVFHRQAAKLVMCNIAQMGSVLDSMLLTSGDKCVPTPSYYVLN